MCDKGDGMVHCRSGNRSCSRRRRPPFGCCSVSCSASDGSCLSVSVPFFCQRARVRVSVLRRDLAPPPSRPRPSIHPSIHPPIHPTSSPSPRLDGNGNITPRSLVSSLLVSLLSPIIFFRHRSHSHFVFCSASHLLPLHKLPNNADTLLSSRCPRSAHITPNPSDLQSILPPPHYTTIAVTSVRFCQHACP